jgi:hypothetical protein
MKQQVYHITTTMGEVNSSLVELDFLSAEELEELNIVGHSGRNIQGDETSRTKFLNSLGKGQFIITQTKFDNGEFVEKFLVSRTWKEITVSTSEELIVELSEMKNRTLFALHVLIEEKSVTLDDGSLSVEFDDAEFHIESDLCELNSIVSHVAPEFGWTVNYTNLEIRDDEEMYINLKDFEEIDSYFEILSALEEK